MRACSSKLARTDMLAAPTAARADARSLCEGGAARPRLPRRWASSANVNAASTAAAAASTRIAIITAVVAASSTRTSSKVCGTIMRANLAATAACTRRPRAKCWSTRADLSACSSDIFGPRLIGLNPAAPAPPWATCDPVRLRERGAEARSAAARGPPSSKLPNGLAAAAERASDALCKRALGLSEERTPSSLRDSRHVVKSLVSSMARSPRPLGRAWRPTRAAARTICVTEASSEPGPPAV
mmetsp:Transcript_41878/g.98290  ORF Transcript_41878/g.98290 Transcript_41878/m.98290 type:complete len:242 (-) Transcript_41878:2598-3323(-)